MKAFKSIVGFVFRRGLDAVAEAIPVAGVKQVAAWTSNAVVHHFTSHVSELTTALQTAHESAWGALAFSLGDDSALDLLRSRDGNQLREQMRTFMERVALGMDAETGQPEFRHHCLEELRTARRAGLLTDGGINVQDLCRQVGSFAEIGNSAKLLDAERGGGIPHQPIPASQKAAGAKPRQRLAVSDRRRGVLFQTADRGQRNAGAGCRPRFIDGHPQ